MTPEERSAYLKKYNEHEYEDLGILHEKTQDYQQQQRAEHWARVKEEYLKPAEKLLAAGKLVDDVLNEVLGHESRRHEVDEQKQIELRIKYMAKGKYSTEKEFIVEPETEANIDSYAKADTEDET